MSQVARALSALIVVIGSLPQLSAQLPIYTVSSTESRFGWQIVGLGDVNNDGRADFAVSAFGDPYGAARQSSVHVFSGKTGTRLFVIPNPSPGQQNYWGQLIADAGDVNGDGVRDLVIGEGVATHLHSGADGARLWSHGHGSSLRVQDAGLGDMNGDGFADVVLGGPAGSVVVSGKDQSWLRQFSGYAAGAIGDVDRDGRADVVTYGAGGGATCISGRTGATIWTSGTVTGAPFTRPVGDVNRDGVPDLVDITWGPQLNEWEARVFSGADASIVLRAKSDANHLNVYRPCAAGDVNGDGYPDILVHGYTPSVGRWVSIYSGRDGKLLFDLPVSYAMDLPAGVGDVDGDGCADLAIPVGPGLERWDVMLFKAARPTYAPFGVGCAGAAGVPSLAAKAGSLPQLGLPFELVLGNLRPLAATFVNFGLSNTVALGLPLPLDLGVIGMPGCTLYCSADFALPVGNITGAGTVSFTFGRDPSLLGVEFWNQALIADPVANVIGIAVTNAAAGRIGS